MSDVFAQLADLGRRFHGVSLDFRRDGIDWPQPWRCRLFSTKNERDGYRLTAYGDTAEAVVTALLVLAKEVRP